MCVYCVNVYFIRMCVVCFCLSVYLSDPMTTAELLSVLNAAVNKTCKIGLRQVNIVNVT